MNHTDYQIGRGRNASGGLIWMKENMLIFREAATAAFKSRGRGAIVVDTTSLPVEGMGHPFGYDFQATIEEADDDDVNEWCGEDDRNSNNFSYSQFLKRRNRL